jgi:Protein of unknown function (DUF1501)
MGEFGRTPELNPALGRDHWPNCYSLVIGGGGIRVGQVIGASDNGGFNPLVPHIVWEISSRRFTRLSASTARKNI